MPHPRLIILRMSDETIAPGKNQTVRKGIGRRPIFLALTLACVGVLIIAAWWVLFGLPLGRRVDPPLPVPNGYDDLVRAGALIPEAGALRSSVSLKDMATKDLRAAVTGCKEALEAARVGIGRECFRPPADAFNIRVDLEMASRRLADAFYVEAVLAEREGSYGDAVKSFGDLTVLGAQWTRGGVFIDFMVGSAQEIIGLTGIGRIREKLDGPAVGEALTVIQRAADLREPFEHIMDRQAEFVRRNSTFLERIEALFDSSGGRNLDIDRRRKQVEALSGLLLADLAARAFHAERGAWPHTLNDLVPAYLKTVPLDPFTGKPLVYRLEANLFVLYSSGPDGKDDGGVRRADGDAGKGDDLSLDDAVKRDGSPGSE